MTIASHILMVRPAAFGYNEETAANNHFQQQLSISGTEIHQKALAEFDAMVSLLKEHHINVHVIEDTPTPAKPDAVFPNNWISTSPSGTISVFPMYAPQRRAEKREDIVQWLSEHFVVTAMQDWSEYEVEGRFLEGTGSMVIDHDEKMIYAAISERTSLPLLEKYAATNHYQAIVFLATDKEGRPVYHTNVMMALGEGFCVLCEESIEEEWELIAVRQLLQSTGHRIIPITREQMQSFAGNLLQVKNSKGELILLLSQTAYNSLRKEQKEILESLTRLLPISIPTIEQVGGGSVRCMVAEVFLEKNL